MTASTTPTREKERERERQGEERRKEIINNSFTLSSVRVLCKRDSMMRYFKYKMTLYFSCARLSVRSANERTNKCMLNCASMCLQGMFGCIALKCYLAKPIDHDSLHLCESKFRLCLNYFPLTWNSHGFYWILQPAIFDMQCIQCTYIIIKDFVQFSAVNRKNNIKHLIFVENSTIC